jgi:ubiquinone/menaquinone biosynthesis C-methylase UbiE
MAIEFPKAQVIGLDLVAYEEDPTTKLPSNLELVLSDCTRGINYPDGHFDIVHTRMLLGGVRDWDSLINESVRVCKPGGMLVFAESDCDWPLVDPVPEGVGQGYLTYFQHLVK